MTIKKNGELNKKALLIYMVVTIFIGYLPWYNYSAVMPYISKEFGFSAMQESLIVSAFQLGYVLIVIFTGWLADKIGTKKVTAWATLCTGVFATAFVFIAHDFYTTLLMRLLTGLSAGAIYAPGMSLLANWFPAKERGKAMGAYTAGMVGAYAGGYFIAAPLAEYVSWRVGMLATSVPVFFAAYILFTWVEESPKTERRKTVSAEKIAEGRDNKGYKGPILLTVSYIGHMWELYAFWGYIGTVMSVACLHHQLPASYGGMLAAWIIILGAPAVYLLGKLADTWGRTKTIIVVSFASLIPEFVLGELVEKPIWFMVIVGGWIGFWVVADSAIYKAGISEMVPDRVRGTVLGIQSAAGYLVTVISPVAFGTLLRKLNGNIPSIEATIWGPCFALLGIGALTAPIFAFLTRRTKESELMAGGKK